MPELLSYTELLARAEELDSDKNRGLKPDLLPPTEREYTQVYSK